jgi:four helix bundle protein
MIYPKSKTSFEELEVYQLAERLSDGIWGMVKKWDRLAQDTVGKQMIRSADSVGANIAEGAGRYSLRDNARFIRYARGSLYETKHWLRRAYQRDLMDASQVEAMKPIIDELLPRLNAYLRSTRQRGGGGIK